MFGRLLLLDALTTQKTFSEEYEAHYSCNISLLKKCGSLYRSARYKHATPGGVPNIPAFTVTAISGSLHSLCGWW